MHQNNRNMFDLVGGGKYQWKYVLNDCENYVIIFSRSQIVNSLSSVYDGKGEGGEEGKLLSPLSFPKKTSLITL